MRTLIFFLFLLLLLLPLGCESVEKPEDPPEEEVVVEEEEKEEKENVAVIVNGIEITEEDLEKYIEDTVVYRAGEDLADEEIREEAIEEAIWTILEDQYFEEKGITVSEREISEELDFIISNHPDAETEEEFFEIMLTEGFTRREIERTLMYRIRAEKLGEIMAKDIEITEEQLFEYYKELEKKFEGKPLKPFEEIKDILRENLAKSLAEETIYDEIEKRREEAEIEIME